MSEQTTEIKNVLEKFQHGYKTRDNNQLSSFLEDLFVSDTDSMIVGTGQQEWIVGPEKIRELVEAAEEKERIEAEEEDSLVYSDIPEDIWKRDEEE